jgi:hypothetical protein
MELVAVEGAKAKRIRPKRERELYTLLRRCPELFDKETQFRVLYVNEGPEKGPDFVAVNKRGHLLLGEVKRGGLPVAAWSQAKAHAKRFAKMREAALNAELAKAGVQELRRELRGFLGSTEFNALLNPSRRKLQLVFVAEAFSDDVLRRTKRAALGSILRAKVTDVKCIEIHTYRVPARATLAIASAVAGAHRRVRR